MTPTFLIFKIINTLLNNSDFYVTILINSFVYVSHDSSSLLNIKYYIYIVMQIHKVQFDFILLLIDGNLELNLEFYQ